ncbi:MAG TPA: hypothetical protein VGM44_24835, partial [Polyangiaceae bacterium]
MLLIFVLAASRAGAQATARFADVPNETRAPAPISTPSATALPAATATAPTAPPRAAKARAQSPDPPPSDMPLATSPAGFTRRLALTHLERAEQLEGRGDVAQALREYTECLAIDSTLGEA